MRKQCAVVVLLVLGLIVGCNKTSQEKLTEPVPAAAAAEPAPAVAAEPAPVTPEPVPLPPPPPPPPPPPVVQTADFNILPDYHLTPVWVKAGCYFRNTAGQDLKADTVHIQVYLPWKGSKEHPEFAYREHRENSVNDPDWSGKWDEPWNYGWFYYTVTATYAGQTFTKTFIPTRNAGFAALETVIKNLPSPPTILNVK